MGGNASLAALVEAAASGLVATSLAYMPRDPFWEERYGERGRRFASEDGAFHLKYLCEALRSGSQSVLDTYALWLRDVLVPRGMCTRHLQQHFEHLASALDQLVRNPLPGAMMRRAAEALFYSDATAAVSVQRAASRVARGEASDGHSAWDPEFLTHYIADAVAKDNPATLAAHLAWARAARGRTPGGEAAFDRVVAAVGESLRGDPATREGAAMLERALETSGS